MSDKIIHLNEGAIKQELKELVLLMLFNVHRLTTLNVLM